MTTRIRFHGAAHTVTGSCHAIETDAGTVLVDCGLFQGSKTLKSLNYEPFPFRAADIRAVLLTHAHIDHSGLLPKLVRDGFRGRIFATQGTIDLCSWMLPDSGNIQETEVATLNRRNAARGEPLVSPIYTQADAAAAMRSFSAVDYEQWQDVIPGCRARFFNAGHLLGSASIEIEVHEQNSAAPLRLLASGDIGPDAKLLQPNPQAGEGYDYVLCESTYGDRERPPISTETRRLILEKEVRDAQHRGGAMLIPAFAVERTQELIFDLMVLMQEKRIAPAPVFIDSPLAIRITEVFKKHAGELEDGARLTQAFDSPYLRFTQSVDESKAIAHFSGFHIIIAASGMCDAGRIRHHLKAWLWQPKATVLLVGYQAQGTLGRFLEDGTKAVRIQGDEIRVAAKIRKLDAYSGHADSNELCKWIAARFPIRNALFLVHGEENAINGLAARLTGDFLAENKIIRPLLDDAYELGLRKFTQLDGKKTRRLAPEAVVNLDWHNEMSKLILDINDQMHTAADDKARSTIIRRMRRALEGDADRR